MIDVDQDRRVDARVSIARQCKVFEPRARKYFAGTTCNVSASGALLRLDRSVPLEPGDRLFVAVPRRRRQGVVRGEEMIDGVIVRVQPSFAGETHLAVRFTEPAEDLIAAAPMAA